MKTQTDADTKLDIDLTDEDLERIEREKKSKEAQQLKFEREFDDFDSFQRRKKMQEEHQQQQSSKSADNTSNYYHEYFINKAKQEAESGDRKRLKKHTAGPRKTEREQTEERETKKLRWEYRALGSVIFAFAGLIGYYFYYLTSSDIGRADSYFKMAIDYEAESTSAELDEEEREEKLKSAEYYYLKALEGTNYAFPKYLHRYSEFLLVQKHEYTGSEHYITKALGLHETNAVYHRFYCKLLKAMIEQNGDIERVMEYYAQREHTVKAHIREATYFLAEEENIKAAIMHFDEALNFCHHFVRMPIASSAADIDSDSGDGIVSDWQTLKVATYDTVCSTLTQFGHPTEADQYWQEGMAEFGDELRIRYAVYCYQQQRFSEAMQIFEAYIDAHTTNVSRLTLTAHAFKARVLMELGEYGRAMEIYKRIVPMMGYMDPMVMGDMLFMLIQTNKTADARDLMKQVMTVLRQQSKCEDVTELEEWSYLVMMNVLLMGQQDKIETANYQCLEMTQKYPDSFEVNFFAGMYYHYYAKNFDKAERYYRNAIGIADEWAKTHYHYALLYKEYNDMAQCLKHVKAAYEKNKSVPYIAHLYEQYYDDNGNVLPEALY